MILITIVNAINDEIAVLLEKEKEHLTKDKILQKVMAMEEAIENLLGLDNGVMNIVDGISIGSWIV
jgi:hypothetical protein